MTRERERRRAGNTTRDAKHRSGGDWTTLMIPEGIEIFQPKVGSYRMDIVPFEVGKGNPYASKGEWYWERTFYTHRGIGPNNESYVCPWKTDEKPCPICEYRASLAKDPSSDPEEIKQLKPKERQLFLVSVHSKDNDERKVQLYESSHHTFGVLLDQLRRDAEDDEEHISQFDDPDAGSTLKASFIEKAFAGHKFPSCYAIEFRARAKGLNPKLLEHGICLDDVVKILPYDDLKRILAGVDQSDDDDEDEDDEERKPSPKKPSARKGPPDDTPTVEGTGIEEGSMVRQRKFGVCEVMRISSDGTSLVIKDDEGEIHKGVGADEVRLIEEEKSPKSKGSASKATGASSGSGRVKKVKPDEDEEDTEDEDADDEEDEDEGSDPPEDRGKKTAKTKAKKTTSRSKDDDWDEEEEEKTPPKKKGSPKASKADEDDWD